MLVDRLLFKQNGIVGYKTVVAFPEPFGTLPGLWYDFVHIHLKSFGKVFFSKHHLLERSDKLASQK